MSLFQLYFVLLHSRATSLVQAPIVCRPSSSVNSEPVMRITAKCFERYLATFPRAFRLWNFIYYLFLGSFFVLLTLVVWPTRVYHILIGGQFLVAFVYARCSETVNGINVIFLWRGRYPRYAHTVFFFFKNFEKGNFKNFFCFCLKKDPMGVQI